MEWFLNGDETKPNTKKANNAWCATRKKLFPGGIPTGAASEGGAAKIKTPATPRKKKDTDAPQTPSAKKTPAKKNLTKAEEEDKVEDVADGDDETPASGPAKTAKKDTKETVDVAVKKSDKAAASNKQGSDVDGETPMKESNGAELAVTTPTTTSVADDMSTGSMSPTPSSPKTKASANTPKAKVAAKGPKASTTEAATTAAKVPLPTTPSTPLPKAAPQKRKSEVVKEAEGGAANGEDGIDGDHHDTPPAKKRKSVDGEAKVESESGDEAKDTDSNDGESAKSTPTKTPRKPSANQLAKREEKAKERATKKAEKEQEKADKKAEKEREKEKAKADKIAEKEREKAEKKAEKEKEKAEKQAAKKGGKTATTTDANAETSKPKTPRKPTAAQQAKKEEPEKANKTAEAVRVAQAAQDVVDKETEKIFKGARTDKPAGMAVKEDDSDEEKPVQNGHDEPMANGFIAINGNAKGKGSRATSAAAVGKVQGAKKATEEDEDTIAVEEEEMISVEEEEETIGVDTSG